MTLDEITQKILKQIDEKGFKQDGAFNLRHNGTALCHGDSEHIMIFILQVEPTLQSLQDAESITAAAMRAGMTESIPFMWRAGRMSGMKKSTTARGKAPAQRC